MMESVAVLSPPHRLSGRAGTGLRHVLVRDSGAMFRSSNVQWIGHGECV
jgi:hypothetical protein